MFNRYNQYFIKRILNISVKYRLILVKHWLIFSWGSNPPPPQWLKSDKYDQQSVFVGFPLIVEILNLLYAMDVMILNDFDGYT